MGLTVEKTSLELAVMRLADMLKPCINIDSGPFHAFIDANKLQELFKDHWSKLSHLSHSIHEGVEAQKKEENLRLRDAAFAMRNLCTDDIIAVFKGEMHVPAVEKLFALREKK